MKLANLTWRNFKKSRFVDSDCYRKKRNLKITQPNNFFRNIKTTYTLQRVLTFSGFQLRQVHLVRSYTVLRRILLMLGQYLHAWVKARVTQISICTHSPQFQTIHSLSLDKWSFSWLVKIHSSVGNNNNFASSSHILPSLLMPLQSYDAQVQCRHIIELLIVHQ